MTAFCSPIGKRDAVPRRCGVTSRSEATSLVLIAHRMNRTMCSRVVGPLACHRSMCDWVSSSIEVACSAVSQLQNSIVTVTVCLARWKAESVTVAIIERSRFSRPQRMNLAITLRCSSAVMRCCAVAAQFWNVASRSSRDGSA